MAADLLNQGLVTKEPQAEELAPMDTVQKKQSWKQSLRLQSPKTGKQASQFLAKADPSDGERKTRIWNSQEVEEVKLERKKFILRGH